MLASTCAWAGARGAEAFSRGVFCHALLTERGVKCDGCAEKKDLIARVEETYDMPVVTAQPVRFVRPGGWGPRSDSPSSFFLRHRRVRHPARRS